MLILLLLEHCCPDQPQLRRCLTCWVLIASQSISLHFCIKWLLILSFLSSLKIKLFGHQRASELQNESKIAFNSFQAMNNFPIFFQTLENVAKYIAFNLSDQSSAFLMESRRLNPGEEITRKVNQGRKQIIKVFQHFLISSIDIKDQ